MTPRRPDDLPSSQDALAAIVREAAAGRDRIRIVGSQSLVGRVPRPPDGARIVSSTALDAVEVDAPNLVVRAQAGVTLEGLRDTLKRHGVIWPVDRLEPGGTLGGLIASGRGTALTRPDKPARRWVLGAQVLDGNGVVLSVGGATVKNSVGYALTQSLWGSEGRLGAILRLTLRLRYRTNADGDSEADGIERVLAKPVQLRCEDVPPDWDRAVWIAAIGDAPLVLSADGTRALAGFAELGAAQTAAVRLNAEGGRATVEGDAPGDDDRRSAPWSALRDALDPLAVFV